MVDQKKYRSFEDLAPLAGQPAGVPATQAAPPAKKQHDGKGASVRVYVDTKGRKGKSVTVVEGLRHNPDTLEDIARILKQHCGAGGTVKEGAVEIQGDQRERIKQKLTDMHYTVRS